MLPKISALDYGLLAGCLLVLVGVGVYFRRSQRTCGSYFLADRSMDWFPTGLSAMLTLLAALQYTDAFGQAYVVGYKYLVLPLAVLCCLPVLTRVVLPLHYRLGVSSIYEYLERRFDVRVRLAGSALCVLWRVLWLMSMLLASGQILGVATGLSTDLWWVLGILGMASTLSAFFGGMRAVIWAGVLQFSLVAVALVLIVLSAWSQLDGGPFRVAQVARAMGRTQVFDLGGSGAELWRWWGVLPYFILAVLSLAVADQVTVQRFLSARSLKEARKSCVWSCWGATILIVAAMYVGLVLLAFYHDHPQRARPIWVANVDPRTHQSMRDAQGLPLLVWGPQAITPDNIDQLIAQRRLLRPNTNRPFEAVNGVILFERGQAQVSIPELAKRKPPPAGLKQGEIILNQLAHDELLPHFITNQYPAGVTGFLLVALLVASMFSFDATVTSIGTLLVTDFHRRRGFGRHWLARHLHKPVEALTSADELHVGRPLVLIVGAGVTGLSLLMMQIRGSGDACGILVRMASVFGGPLLAVFLLGMFTRRTTATAALTTLVAGTVCSLGLSAAHRYEPLCELWPWSLKLPDLASLPLGVLFSLVWGYLISLVLGQKKSNDQLRGLVAGIGSWGVCQPEASVAIPESFDTVEERAGPTDKAP
ncbi:MAG: sodium:solute symporter family transporter [Pirellulaceae bacterium]